MFVFTFLHMLQLPGSFSPHQSRQPQSEKVHEWSRWAEVYYGAAPSLLEGRHCCLRTRTPVLGAASVIVGYPLDTVKTRLQAGVGYRGTLHCIRTVYSRESVFGFFKGMSFPLASIAVYNSVVFGVFSNTQRLLGRHRCGEPEASPPRSLSDLLLASMVAGVVSVGLGGPVDLIKIRLQMQTQPFQEAKLSRTVALGEQPAYQGPVHCFATIVRTEGLAGLYRGASAMLLRDVPGYCLYFIPYVLLSEWITPEACASPSPCAVWLAGGVAGKVYISFSALGEGGNQWATHAATQGRLGAGTAPSSSPPLPSGAVGMAVCGALQLWEGDLSPWSSCTHCCQHTAREDFVYSTRKAPPHPPATEEKARVQRQGVTNPRSHSWGRQWLRDSAGTKPSSCLHFLTYGLGAVLRTLRTRAACLP
uniref:Solute carrier family 25 member 48 n=1 Tax=Oryctolagus cuniculus TaxID=9986 RepID=A0A5F9D415_RABIT